MSEAEEYGLSGVALLYQKDEGRRVVNKVRSVLVPTNKDDDEYSLKAKAERYIAEDEALREQTKDYHIVAWHISTEVMKMMKGEET